jgi:hypothetical protein
MAASNLSAASKGTMLMEAHVSLLNRQAVSAKGGLSGKEIIRWFRFV